MLASIHHLKILGVVNITPNSFSDPKKFLDSHTLTFQLEHYKKRINLAFDFGFESTAPMNHAISATEERERFDRFFEVIKEIDLDHCWISFDTYRTANFRYFEERFRSRYSHQGFIFNDVSGVLDEELRELLKERRLQENFHYIHSFTHIPSRDQVLDHMNFIKEGSITEACIHSFKKGIELFSKWGVEDKIILDPGFGFSKTIDQNWQLLHHFEDIHKALGFKGPWLIGISKKSFLRKIFEQSSDPFLESEILHRKIIKDLLEQVAGQLLFRVHDFDILERD